MSSNGKREIIRSLDHLLYCQFVYNYFLDSSLLQLLSPKALTRSIRTAFFIVTAGWLVVIILHVTSEPGQPGIIIDFIGNLKPPTITRLLLLDCVIYLFQIMRVLITSSLSSQLLTNGTAVATLQVPPALAAALGTENLTLMLPPSNDTRINENLEENNYHNTISSSSTAPIRDDTSQTSSAHFSTDFDGLYYGDELVVDIGLKDSIKNLIFVDSMRDDNPSTSRDGSERLPV
ncbi:hypothetical protein BDF20DRAFT_814754 [Mycotypha africana]|uniref:uncharacterized protein n=1 Tax=Mycotypha africana TaxID=64632 RepID=UPI0023018005|nr:uncharacterized protein BDF20DRAFT_814754 [Mycotypha africana]KAI8988624.1 hypothetical protein BDF20DRAFT_814754 [Mycotypha africana]